MAGTWVGDGAAFGSPPLVCGVAPPLAWSVGCWGLLRLRHGDALGCIRCWAVDSGCPPSCVQACFRGGAGFGCGMMGVGAVARRSWSSLHRHHIRFVAVVIVSMSSGCGCGCGCCNLRRWLTLSVLFVVIALPFLHFMLYCLSRASRRNPSFPLTSFSCLSEATC